MGRTHVWLLHRGAPQDRDTLSTMLTQLAPGRVPGWLAWAGALGRWLWRGWWSRRLLPGPDASRERAELQAKKLGAVLGEAYSVRAVFGLGEDGVAGAGSHLRAREQVILIDMAAQGGALARTRRRDADQEIARRGATLQQAPSLSGQLSYVEAIAETLRAAIADLPRGARYEVALVALDLPPPAEDGDASAALLTATKLASAAHLDRPYHTSFLPGPGLKAGTARASLLEAARRSPEGVLVVPLNTACEGSAELALLDSLLAEVGRSAPGTRLIRAAALDARPTFVRALAEAVTTAEGAATPANEKAV